MLRFTVLKYWYGSRLLVYYLVVIYELLDRTPLFPIPSESSLDFPHAVSRG